ncbi:MAG TPA: hypothetical protein VF806_06980 [Anaerolineaceae bacterium]
MDVLRKPFFIAALVLLVIIVGGETGTQLIPIPASFASQAGADKNSIANQLPEPARTKLINQPVSVPAGTGKAIPAMALVDGLLLFTIAIIALDLFTEQKVPIWAQSGATVIFTIIILIVGITLIFTVLALVLFMVALFLAFPFGTLAYIAGFGFFDTGSASAALSAIMAMKVAFVVCLFLAQQRFIQNLTLLLMVATSFIANIVISFLHGIVPGILVSITDGIAAIVMGVLAAIWAIVILIPSIISVIKALKPGPLMAPGTA